MAHDILANLLLEIDALDSTPGVLLTDMLEMPDTIRVFFNWILRRKHVTLEQVAAYLNQEESGAVLPIITGLTSRGLVEELEIEGETRYRLKTRSLPQHRHVLRMDLWDDLE